MMTLSAWMKREGLNAEEAADRIGCDRSTLVRILPGKNGTKPKRRPGWKLLRKIVLGTKGEVTANDFMDDDLGFSPVRENGHGPSNPSEQHSNSARGVTGGPKERAA